MKLAVIVSACLVLFAGGCASTSRMMSYGDGGIDDLADAKFRHSGRDYSLWIHRQEDMIMLQRDWGVALGQGLIRGATYGLVEMRDPYEAWKGAADAFVAPTGCSIGVVRPIDQDTAWEAAYSCPDPVNLRTLVLAQRPALRRGAPLFSPKSVAAE